MTQRLWLAAFLLSAPALHAGDVVTKASDKLTLTGFTQAQFGYRSNLPDSLVNSTTYIKRARVKFTADISKHAESELELDFASSRLVKDAVLAILPSEALRLEFGQFKRPFSQEELSSSSATPVVDLGLTNALSTGSLGYSGRSQGLMLAFKPASGRFDLQAGAFSGAGDADLAVGDKLAARQTDQSNRGKDFAGRAGALLGEATTLHLAANFSARSLGGNFTDGTGAIHRAGTFTALGADAELKHGPLSVWAEVLSGDNFSGFTDTLTSYSAPTFVGWHVAANYVRDLSGDRSLTAWQVEGRFEVFDPDTDTGSDGSSLFTAGWALFLGPQVRWRTNGEWTTFQAGGSTSFRLVSELQARF